MASSARIIPLSIKRANTIKAARANYLASHIGAHAAYRDQYAEAVRKFGDPSALYPVPAADATDEEAAALIGAHTKRILDFHDHMAPHKKALAEALAAAMQRRRNAPSGPRR